MTSPSRVGSHSPASPRLPSPPPFPEVQIGHRSPSPSSARSSLIETPEDHPSEDYGAARRIRPGTKAADMASGPPLVPLAELDSAFQLQEHLKSLYLSATTSPTSPDLTQPITRESATFLAGPPPGIERSLWLYELCRFLVQRTNALIVGFFADNPPCSAANCSEMRASEWQYLCAVHDPPKSCCAIDYCCHTLDWAANTLTSQRHFPSRLTLGTGLGGKEGATGNQTGGAADAASIRQLTNIFRRVYRMFAHAWFQHRDVFWTIENQEGLYVFYKTVCDVYDLIPEDNYTVPPEAEGLTKDEKQVDDGGWTRESLHGTGNTPALSSETARSSRPSSLQFNRGNPSSISEEYSAHNSAGDTTTILGTGATTRRHKHTPSTGSFVTTIHEGDEEMPSPAKPPTGDSPFIGADIPSSNTTTAAAVSTEEQEEEEPPKAPKTARLINSENKDPQKDTPSAATAEPSTKKQSSESDAAESKPESQSVEDTSGIVIKTEEVPASLAEGGVEKQDEGAKTSAAAKIVEDKTDVVANDDEETTSEGAKEKAKEKEKEKKEDAAK